MGISRDSTHKRRATGGKKKTWRKKRNLPMDTNTDFFHHIPDEVVQLIFSRISDCKLLVQCMLVSKAFRQHAIRVPSLSIVCPGNFSTYDERLLKIYNMVKAFRNLQSLVVRVGQPKEEPPSWARCMRYAEIGGSVEKFMFMAAKCGDFSELDATLLGLADTRDKLQGKAWSSPKLAVPLEAVVHTDMDRPELIETRTSSISSISMGDSDDRNAEAWSDVESDEDSGQRALFKITNPPNYRICGEQKQQKKRSQYDVSTSSDASFLLEQGQRKPLSQFSLRQVIAPSNDVLKRMLPVIHFAIVQGLNELRDSLPGFVAMFAELRSFLLVDMAESITVFMREHHIQELKSLYLRDLDGETNQSKEALEVEPFFSGLGLGRGEVSGGKMGEEEPAVENKGNRELVVLDSRHVFCAEDAMHASQHGSRDKQVDDALVISQMPKDEVEERQDLTVLMNEGSFPRGRTEGSSSRVLSTRKLPLLQSVSRNALEVCKGKEKLLEYQDVNLQEYGGHSASSLVHMHTIGCTDVSTLPGIKEPINGSLGGCSFLPGCQAKADSEEVNATGLAGLKGGRSDSESLYQGMLAAHSTACLVKPLTRLGPSKAFDAVMATPCAKERDWSCESDTELEGTGGFCVVSCEGGTNKQAHLSDWDGLSGKLDCQDGKSRENGYRLQGVRCLRDAKADWGSKPVLKRCHRSDGVKRTEFSKSLQYSGGLRGFGGLFRGASVEEMDAKRSGIDKMKYLMQASAGDVCNAPLVASCSSGVGASENGGGVWDTHVSLDKDNSNKREESVLGAITEGARQNERHAASDDLMRDRRTFPWEAHENARQRLADADAWRHVWQERVRRLRETLQMAPGQDLRQPHDDLREQSRNRLRRQQAMEKDALSFNYTFWRAEQVSSCDYVMSDISMCIATHASQTLGDAEKEVLLQAAIAGPLLVATVSHVNKHYHFHNL